jgi:hypothetical protein
VDGRPVQECGAARLDERLQPRAVEPRELVARQQAAGHQRVVQFIGVPRVGKRLLPHLLDRRHVEHGRVVHRLRVPGPPRLHRVRAPFLERRVVEKRIRFGVEDGVGKDRRLRGVACEQA